MINLVSRSAQEREHRVQARMRTRVESLFRRRLGAEFERLAREVATDPDRYEQAVTRHESRLEVQLRSAYRATFVEFGARALARLKPANGKSEEALLQETKTELDREYSEAVEAFVRRWSVRKATQISNTSRAKIQRVVAQATREGLGEREAGALILERVGGAMGNRRARMIARTETHSASQDAAFEVAQASGIDIMKQWVAVEDGRTREDHLDIDGTEIAMHERFKVGEDELFYPGDPTASAGQIINCRCVLVYNPVRLR